ncbi:imidazole glycerol phosphate synthase subunit HisH [Sinanaerobacter sp. ZZT-01]|uniref:imidazole glycerol phosphate synthase subunit HisH n=1 Tax=Sinanaerobacter sp. ZZT-01 TaxID=3111540 RepID=UPI002D77FD5D|nr:imidazole glycerol phosphate synthase subunit HisH [Sinanaerobacter sp. ZZT-01]WRR92123.1 imidazole glycerol phosphate synthase subunit HisH [Sinanaerobacter sp. ZZT-01]
MIAIIDYGVGNLFSLRCSLDYLKLESIITNREEDILKADRILLPGVGAFSDAIQKLRNTGLVDVIKSETEKGKPLLGICLGMQLLFEKSFEFGEHQGLGLIKGEISSLKSVVSDSLKIPHIGWNRLQRKKEHPLLKYTKEGDYVYYVHSFYADNCVESIRAVSEYQIEIPGAVAYKNICGTQFHPEKSGEAGLRILQAFAELS